MNKKKPFIVDVIALTSVPIFSQVIGILIVPIITRMYTPDTFGISNLLGTVVMLFATFSTMGYHRGIILPKNKNTAIGLVYLCLSITLIVTILIAFIIIFLKDFIIFQTNSPILGSFLWLTPLFVFFHGLFQVLRFWNIRLNQFGNIAISRVTDIVSKKSVQLFAGIFGYATAGGLIVADLFAIIFKNLFLLKSFSLQIFHLGSRKYSLLKLIAIAKRYKKFPKYFVWSEWLIRIPIFFTSFIIAKYFGQDILGYYSLGLLVLSLPSLLIGGAVSEVFSPRAAEAKHKGEHVVLLNEIFYRLLKLMLFPFMILGLFGDRLFSIVFSPEWITAGIIAQVLSIRVLFDTIFAPVFTFTNILEKQELEFTRSFVNTLIVICSMLMGVYFNNFETALWLITILDSLLIITLGIYLMRIINFPIFKILQKFSIYCIICFSVGLMLKLFDNFFSLSTINFLIVIFFATISYYGMLLATDRVLFKKIRQVILSFIK